MTPLLIIVPFLALVWGLRDPKLDCTASQYDYENYLGTKTPYRLVANKSFDKIEYPGCDPQKAWMLIRHGTRNPSQSHITQYNKRLPEIRDVILANIKEPTNFINNRDLDLFRKWKSRVDEEDDKKLRSEGEQEMTLLGERMQSRFPQVFDYAYSNTSYKFKHTHTQRTKKSALYFSTGLFGKHTAKDVWYPQPLKKDPVLRFYKLCNKWQTDVKNKPIPEFDKFRQSQPMQDILVNVKNRLNIHNNLSMDDVETMYLACAFETAWNHLNRSPWCSVFSIDDFKAMEYLSDLKYYWIDGYGFNITYEQACPIFSDMFQFISSQEKYPKVSAYFTHSGTMLKTLAHLGLYKDKKPLLSDDFASNSNRLWKTGLIDAFASNLAFVLFKCGEQLKVLTMHQENIIRLPCCPDEDLCDLDTIRKYYVDSIEQCHFDDLCRI